jgi:hypothetical protein
MSKRRKILLLCWTLWPLVYFFLFFFGVMGLIGMSIYMERKNSVEEKTVVTASPQDADSKQSSPEPIKAAEPEGFPLFAIPLIAIHLLTIFNQIALLGYYIYHLFRKNQVLTKDSDKLVWLLLIFFLNMFCMPVYWYLFIWKPRPLPGAAQ